MKKEINITIENKLLREQRDLNVYHHADRSAHMISHNSSITLPLKPVLEGDYLHVSVVSGPGDMEHGSVVDLPSWVDFEITSGGDTALTHSGDRALLKIPPGPPTWQLKMTRSSSSVNHPVSERVTINDSQSGLQ